MYVIGSSRKVKISMYSMYLLDMFFLSSGLVPGLLNLHIAILTTIIHSTSTPMHVVA